MLVKNVEFKAKVDDLPVYEQRLLTLNPYFKGADHQVDIYFKVAEGRLKLREGNIENALIGYQREDTATAKLSNVLLYPVAGDATLKTMLTKHLGVKVVVDKLRRIYFIDNVKFHFDTVAGLGTFIEVEAIDKDGRFSADYLREQCDKYFAFFELETSQLQSRSYSDMLMELI